MIYKDFRKTTGNFPNDDNDAAAILPLYQEGKMVKGIAIGVTKEWLDDILIDQLQELDLDMYVDEYLDQLEMSEENVMEILEWLEIRVEGTPYHIIYEVF
ncbi:MULTISPECIES: hypothetical protein [Enterococcus]|uniref:Uncharacterized protein n=1 Tax=Candidatus Enterococcus ferrettii TaxID=2815324 RepID=A0ABV0EV26_9ENTE|nr:hypothetical protein [Enterococcus sp. 665A]MBO1340336.1 hypothetical protein [Enterococcus sp. 665A]